ncbi:MAG TPA: fumarylacetoacetate hydrolase family protein [bacterium]|nr:fumarylacetoacetate hydrolase family protein [bacterium]
MAHVTMHTSGEKIPVSKILCVGQNYREHIIELTPEGKEPDFPTEPVIFMKPPSALIYDGGTILRPSVSNDMHHEVELIIVIGKTGKQISPADAMHHVLGYAVGLDMTLRDLQSEAKKKGRPWTIAKGFDTSACISQVMPKEQTGNIMQQDIKLLVNGTIRQNGNTSDMIFDIATIVSYVSQFFTLERGDLIYTGTPKGVGPVVTGDQLHAILGNDLLKVNAKVG